MKEEDGEDKLEIIFISSDNSEEEQVGGQHYAGIFFIVRRWSTTRRTMGTG